VASSAASADAAVTLAAHPRAARARQAGSSPLALAVVSGDAACARALLARGAHVNARDRDGWTPLMWAAARGDAACVSMLLDAARQRVRNGQGARTGCASLLRRALRADARRAAVAVAVAGGTAHRERSRAQGGRSAADYANSNATRALLVPRPAVQQRAAPSVAVTLPPPPPLLPGLSWRGMLSIAGAVFFGDVTLNAILGRFLLFLLLTSAVSSAAMRALRNSYRHVEHDDHHTMVTTRTLLEAVRRHDTTEQTIVELVTGAYIGDKDEARLAELLLEVDEVCTRARRRAGAQQRTHECVAS
jgi:hypothetical protein